jgi:hypothetical protein
VPPAVRPAVVPARPAPVELDERLLADAGETFVIGVSRVQEPGRGQLGFAMADMRAVVGVDVFDPTVLAALEADGGRQIVMSWGSVDPKAYRTWLASPHPPQPGDGFAIRFRVTVPVRDAATAVAALDRVPIGEDCARPGDGARWSAFLAGLTDEADRRAAAQSGNAFVCAAERQSGATVARIDGRRRELLLDSAIGRGRLVDLVVSPPRLAPASVVAQLRADGFFDAHVGFFATPGASARYRASMLLFKLTAGFEGLDPEMRPRLWAKATDELGSFERLVNSPPALFDEILMKDMATSWGLTPEGARAFASLAGREMIAADDVRAEVARAIHPGGAFADARTLADTIHKASHAEKLFEHFLWPQVAAFTAGSPELQQLVPAPTLPFGGVFFELDQPRRRLNLHM